MHMSSESVSTVAPTGPTVRSGNRPANRGAPVSSDELPQEFQIDVPDEMETGVPADFASVWHTPTSFILDFIAVKQPPSPVSDPESGEVTSITVPGRVVSRVRIPPQQVFELAKALTMQLDAWEKESAPTVRNPGVAEGPDGPNRSSEK